MRFFPRWKGLTWQRHTEAAFDAPAPESPFYVIGDVHGMPDLLEQLLGKLDQSIPVVLVGDYIDRGPDSAGVLRFLLQRPNLICLKGNHEDMLLKFLSDPLRHGKRWLRYGGMETVQSFGLRGVSASMSEGALIDLAASLREAIGSDIMSWLQSLPTSHTSGNIAVCHAGADPQVPIDAQSDKTLVWGHPSFETQPRTDGVWVIHGHVIVDTPTNSNGRIDVDTGAYATRKLTAALVSSGDITFVTT